MGLLRPAWFKLFSVTLLHFPCSTCFGCNIQHGCILHPKHVEQGKCNKVTLNILHQAGLNKPICARFVPHALTTAQHHAAIVKKFLANRNVAVLHHPPYLPDLAPADYFLFPKLKFSLKGRHFQIVEEIQCAVTREINNISKTTFLEGMKKLKGHANKCTDQGGIYFEEKKNYVHIRSYLCIITVVLKLLVLTLYVNNVCYVT